MDIEIFYGDYTVTGILSNVGEQEGNTCAIAVSKASLTQWAGFDPAGYHAYVHFRSDRQLGQDVMTAYCQESAVQYGRPHVGMNSNCFAYYSKSIDFTTIDGIAASLSLDGILLLIVSSVVLTRSPEQAARLFFPDGDYKLYLSSEQPEEEIMSVGNPLNDELRQEILSVDGITDVLVTRQSLHAKFVTSTSAEAGMCDALTNANRPDVEAALVSGVILADTNSVLLISSHQKHHPEVDVGVAMELSLGQETVTVTISGLLDPARIANGHGALALDSAAMFAPEELFREVSKRSFAGEIVPYQFPALEMVLFLLVLFSLEFLLSAWMVSRQKKHSLIEQMRTME